MHLPSEILLYILKHADIEKTPALLRINSQWFTCGICLTWRRVVWGALSEVPPHRRQIYASVIQEFSIFPGIKRDPGQFSDLSFPKLKSLYITLSFSSDGLEAETPIETSHLKCYLHSGLTTIKLNGTFDVELFRTLPVSCPRLLSFSLSCSHPSLETFFEFLRNSPLLSSISISSMGLVTDGILRHLAGRPNLESLSLPGDPIDAHTLGALDIPAPFESLQYLSITLAEAALPSLVDTFESILRLHLTIEKPEGSDYTSAAFGVLSKLRELQTLHLLIMGDMRSIANEDLLSLRNLSQLRSLIISGVSSTSLIAPRFKDRDFEDLFQSLGQLDWLSFHIHTRITSDSLVSLGKCCPLLQKCEIMGIYDMTAFRYEKAPLFPVLQSLQVGAFTNTECILGLRRPYDHVLQLEKHFPNLLDLTCTFRTIPLIHPEDDFAERVVNLWWKRKEKARKAKV